MGYSWACQQYKCYMCYDDNCECPYDERNKKKRR